MNYTHFLFSQLYYAIFPNTTEYDTIFGEIQSLYNEYENSDFNDANNGEYESMTNFLNSKKVIPNNLEKIFLTTLDKKKEVHLKYVQTQIDRWNQSLKACNGVMEALSFLREQGVNIEKVCCTPFNQNEVSRGFYPYLRWAGEVYHPNYDGDKLVIGKLDLEAFVKKIVERIKL